MRNILKEQLESQIAFCEIKKIIQKYPKTCGFGSSIGMNHWTCCARTHTDLRWGGGSLHDLTLHGEWEE